MMNKPLLIVKNLDVGFATDAGLVNVLNKVDFEIIPAEIKG